jgi:hypothetical protein
MAAVRERTILQHRLVRLIPIQHYTEVAVLVCLCDATSSIETLCLDILPNRGIISI